MIIPVIISGGSGSRLWPISRQNDPKPFLKLSDGLSLLQHTFLRANNISNKIITVTNQKIFFRMQDEYTQINQDVVCDFILEPFGRNTAPAVLLAALHANKYHSLDDLLLILPADHLINNVDEFTNLVNKAATIAKEGYLVTFGVRPEYPETGYGYIQSEQESPILDGYLVKRFVEKPDLERANHYINSGDYLWNSGMFLGSIKTILNEFQQHATKLFSDSIDCLLASEYDTYKKINHIVHLNADKFDGLDNISIDYALCEKTTNLAVIPCSISWSDIGSWLSIADTLAKDENHNVIIGDGEIVSHNTTNSLLYSADNRILAAVGLDGLIVVDTPDAVLVTTRQCDSNDLKNLVTSLHLRGHHTSYYHKTIHHVWGFSDMVYYTKEASSTLLILKVSLKSHASYNLIEHLGHYLDFKLPDFVDIKNLDVSKDLISDSKLHYKLKFLVLNSILSLIIEDKNTQITDACNLELSNNQHNKYYLQNDTKEAVNFLIIVWH